MKATDPVQRQVVTKSDKKPRQVVNRKTLIAMIGTNYCNMLRQGKKP